MSISLAASALTNTQAWNTLSSGVSSFCNSLLGGGSTGATSSNPTSSGQATSPAATGSGFSDQLQALLLQMQQGGTAAPSGAAQTASLSTGGSDPSTGAAHGHHGHHHHGGSGTVGSEDSDLQELAGQVAQQLQGSSASASGSTAASGSGSVAPQVQTFASDLAQALQAYGGKAAA